MTERAAAARKHSTVRPDLSRGGQGHRRIGVEEILNAVAQLAYTFRTREIVLQLITDHL